MKRLLLLFGMISCWVSMSGQPNFILSTTPPLTANGSGSGSGGTGISFNLHAFNAINLLEFTTNTPAGTYEVWYNTDSVNGMPTITTANGWVQHETGPVVSASPGTIVLQNELNIPVGETYGIFLYFPGNTYQYHPHTATDPVIFADNNLKLHTGPGVAYAGGLTSPGFHPRQYVGSITYELAVRSPNDAGATAVDSILASCAGAYPVMATIENFGDEQLDSVTVNWSVDGVVQTPVDYKNLLDTMGGTGPSTALINLGNFTFGLNQNYTINVWTTNPNGTVDTVTYNDTATAVAGLARPFGLVNMGTTASTATIAWNTFLGTGFTVEWGPVGYTQGFGSSATTVDTFYTITGLNPLAHYDVYVADSCGVGAIGAFAGPLTITTSCNAPLAGTYTVNATQPFSATNFVSFDQLGLALNLCGVSGPVTINVTPFTGPYNDQLNVGEITGASATNTVTINGNGNYLEYLSTNTDARATVILNGTDWLTIDSLNITALGSTTSEYGFGVSLTNNADHNTIRNCNITVADDLTSANYAGITISSSLSGPTTIGNTSGNYNTIEGNIITGAYYGITCVGTSTDSVNGNIILNNVVEDFYYYGIYGYYMDHGVISGNDVSRPGRTALTTFYGVRLYGGTSTKVENNRIHNSFTQDPASTSITYALYTYYMDGSVSDPSVVANNLLYDLESDGTMYAIYAGYFTNSLLVNNTLVLEDPTHTGTGSPTTRAMYLLGNFTGGSISNNLLYVNRAGTGTTHIVYASGIISEMDNNNYFVPSGAPSYTFGYYGGGAINDFNAWRSNTGLDASSSFGDPYFVDLANDDFHPRSAVLDGGGKDFAPHVTMDIDSVTRGTPPDVGAYEFTGAPCTGLSQIGTTNVSATSGTIVWAQNPATVEIYWGPQGFLQASLAADTIYVPVGDSSSVLGSLTPLGCYEYYLSMKCTSPIPGAPPALMGPYIFCTDCASGPLSGTYTIGGAAGPTNFPTLDSAITMLNGCGINAPVVFNMQGGTYNAFTLGQVTGSSATNTITFNGSANYGDSIVAGSQTAAVDLDGASNVFFNDLYIENTGGNFVVWLHNSAKNVGFDNCELIGSATTTTSSTAVVAATGTNSSASSYGDNVNGLTIEDCKIVGNYYGVSLNGSATTSKIRDLSFINNEFENQYYYGLRLYYTDSVELRGNRMNNFRNTSSYGIYSYYTDNATITGNAIYGTGYSALMFGYTNYSNATPGSYSIVANNMLQSSGTYGVYCYYPVNADFHHNTIVGGGTYGLYLAGSATATQDVDVRNNIIVNSGSGTAMYISTAPMNTTIDYNVYYSGGDIANNGAAYTTLAAWQTADTAWNDNSVEGDPLFVGPSDLHVLGVPANNAGDNSVGITTDIDGDPRPASGSTTVDIGADEYTPVTDDLAIINGQFIKQGKCLSASDTIMLEVQNVIGATKNFSNTPLVATYDVTGPVNTSGTITVNTGTLAPFDTVQMFGFPVDLSIPGVYTLDAYISSSSLNLSGLNDTLVVSGSITIYPNWEVNPDSVVTIINTTDTVELEAKSPFFGGSKFFITEIMHFNTAVGTPSGGWPSWYNTTVGEHIEITGVPGSDLGGITFEQWNTSGTTPTGTHTFPPGTVLGPNGTAVVAMRPVTASPSDFYYDGSGGNTIDWQSSGGQGVILKDAGGTIIDAAGYPASTGTYTFPAAAGVTSAEWGGGTIGSATTTTGVRLVGPDLNDASNWVVVSSTQTQDPNTVNPGVQVPTPGSVQGFSWTLNGNVIDTLPNTVVGPYTSPGVYNYIATYNSPCGVFTDTVQVIVNLSGCLPPANLIGTAVACDSILVNWNNGADSSLVAYVATGGTPPTGTLVMGDSSFAAVGVTPATDYDFYVANICGGDTSVMVGPYTINSGTAGAPVADFTSSSPNFNTTVEFDASPSFGTRATYDWDFGDGNPGTGRMVTHNYASGGTYSVTLTVTNDCGTHDTTITLADVSLSENRLSRSLMVYPNPSTSEVKVSFDSESQDKASIRLLDLSGKQIMVVKPEAVDGKVEQPLNISRLADGVYLLEISNGTLKANKRLIKQ